MNTHVRKALTRVAIGGAVLLMLQCGTDPFAGTGTTLPPEALQCGQQEASGGCGSSSSSPNPIGFNSSLESGCSGQVFVKVYMDDVNSDCCLCDGDTLFLLCSGGTFSACDCEYPGPEWTRADIDAGIPPETGVEETGAGDTGAAEASSEAGADGASGLPAGAPCTVSTQCASDDCASDPGWCTHTCSTSTDCPNAPYTMWCIEDSADADYCFPDCTTTDCSAYGSAYSCKTFTTVEGDTAAVCST